MDYSSISQMSCVFSQNQDVHLTQPDAHYGYQMMLVTQGEAKMVIGHKTYQLKAKSLVFISRMERHYMIFQQGAYHRMVASMSSDLMMAYIKDVELVSVFMQRPKAFCHVIDLSDVVYDQVYPLFQAMCVECQACQQFYVSKSVSLMVEILINLYRAYPESFPQRGNSSVSEVVLNAQRAVHNRFDQPLTLQAIADENFISRHTLSVAFKEIVGITFKEYLIVLRISEAKKMLITTDLSVYHIAEGVGYGNVNNFIKMFKAREHQTPLQYRKQFAES